jgi:hypothetical protein
MKAGAAPKNEPVITIKNFEDDGHVEATMEAPLEEVRPVGCAGVWARWCVPVCMLGGRARRMSQSCMSTPHRHRSVCSNARVCSYMLAFAHTCTAGPLLPACPPEELPRALQLLQPLQYRDQADQPEPPLVNAIHHGLIHVRFAESQASYS